MTVMGGCGVDLNFVNGLTVAAGKLRFFSYKISDSTSKLD